MKSKLWLYLSIVILMACNNSKQEPEPEDNLGIKDANEKRANNLAMIADLKQNIQDGDLILRTGNDYSSEQIKLFSKKDQTYSHAGIAVHDSGDIYIYHVMPDYFHIKDKVRKEKLDSFCNPVLNIGLGHARYNLDTTEAKAFLQYLNKQYQKAIPFDMVFDLQSNDSMYCSEMIKKGLILATKDRIHLENEKFTDRSKYRLISQHFKMKEKTFAGREYVPIDHLFLHPECTIIKRYVYE